MRCRADICEGGLSSQREQGFHQDLKATGCTRARRCPASASFSNDAQGENLFRCVGHVVSVGAAGRAERTPAFAYNLIDQRAISTFRRRQHHYRVVDFSGDGQRALNRLFSPFPPLIKRVHHKSSV